MLKDSKRKEIETLKKYLQSVRKMKKIINSGKPEESLSAEIGTFAKKMQIASTDQNEVLIKLCREFCTEETNITCLAQEVLAQENITSNRLTLIKEEKKYLLVVLAELDKLTFTSKSLTNQRRQELVNVIKSVKNNTFDELYQYWDEIKQVLQMSCTTELSLKEANGLLQLIQNNLKKL